MIDIKKHLNFVILFPEFRFGGLQTTVTTIKSNFDKATCICVMPENSDNDNFNRANKICPAIKSGTTISSMINTGVEKSKKNWNLVVMSGNIIRYKPITKYERFLQSEKDILYRVADIKRWKWEDTSIHGILMHKDAIKEVGYFPEDEESIPLCKLLWEDKAIKKGYNFKGLVGVRLI